MFSLYELSRFLGLKVAFYRFTLGVNVWRFTSADRDLPIGAELFLSCPGIEHTALRESVSSARKNQVTVTLPYRIDPNAIDPPISQSLGDNWFPYPPGDRVLLDILTMHYGDPDAEVNAEWRGRVLGPVFTDTELKLTCDPSFRSSKATGADLSWMRGCGIPHYSQGRNMCNLAKELHAVPATLTAVTGLQLTAAAFGTAPRNLAGGFVEWTRTDGLLEKRTVRAHTGTAIVIDYGARDLASGLVMTAYPGCSHDPAGCASYGNSINYPGYKHMPTEDPMPRSQAW